MVKVYRLEHEDGTGPYQSGTLYGLKGSYYDLNGRHPAPNDDPRLAKPWRDLRGSCAYRFGFASLDQFKRWFYEPADHAVLAEKGFAVSVYELPAEYVLEGVTQAVFNRDHAVLVERLPLAHGASL